MTNHNTPVRSLNCKCGKVKLEISVEPIVATTCTCESCQIAGRKLEALSGASAIFDASGGTPYVMFRKDYLKCLSGENLLDEYRLKPTSSTRRVVAACCNSPMFLDFTKGHWVSVYDTRLSASNTAKSQIKSKEGFFILRLISTWIMMGFKTPNISFIRGQSHVQTA